MVASFSLFCVLAQAPAPEMPVFEVASIRPSAAGGRGSSIHTGEAKFSTRNVSLFALITFAYGIQSYQLTGAPDWMRSETYDIAATHEADEPVPNSDQAGVKARDARTRARVQRLLAERFGLSLRAEQKELPVYALVEDKGGRKIKPSTGGGGNMNTNQNNGNGVVKADGVPLKHLAIVLGGVLGRPVNDETGMDGLFDFELKWSADSASDGGPTLFTALREQLGLRLDARKGPVTTYVVEKAERPSEN